MDPRSFNVNLRNSSAPRPFSTGPRTPEPAHESRSEDDSKKDNKFILKAFDKIIGLSIFMMFFGIPLYFTGLASQGIVFEKQIYFYIWLLLGLAVWAAKGVMSGEMKIQRTPLDLPILGAWLAYGVATIFSVDVWHSFWGSFSDPSRGFMSVTAYLIAYYFILSNFNAGRLKLILTAIISSGAILIIWTLLAIFGVKFLPDALIPYSPISLVGSITGLGIIFSALVPLLTVVILKIGENMDLGKMQRKIILSVMFIILALDLFLILALYNYVPWLGFFIGVVILLVFILAKIMRPSSNWIWLPMVIFILVMILRMIGTVSIGKINFPVEVSLNYNTATQIAKESLKDKFLVGSGPGSYGYAFSLYKPKDFNLNAFYNLRFFQGTGILTEAAPTVGAVGTFFLIILIFSYLGTQIYFLYRDKEKNKLYSLGIFSAASILLVDILSIRADGVILAISVLFMTLALGSAIYESQDAEKKLNLSLKTSPKFALALAFVFMVVSAGVAFLFVFLGKIYASDLYAGKAALSVSTNPEGSLSYMSKAINYNKQEPRYYTQLGQYYMAMANLEAGKDENSRDLEKIQQYLNNSIVVASQAKNIAKKDIGSIESLALIYENAGLYVADSLSLSEENYKKAQEFEPHNPIYYLKLGQIKISMAQGKKEMEEKKQMVSEARDLFQKSIDEKSNYAEGYYQLALANEALNELDPAIENGLKAVQINAKNINYLISLGRMYQERNKNDDMKAAEQFFKAAVALNDQDINSHFYLGLYYEKSKNKEGAKNEYNKVISLIEQSPSAQNNTETIEKLNRMVSNLDRGIENTPESLGLVQPASEPVAPEPVQPAVEDASPAVIPNQPVITP